MARLLGLLRKSFFTTILPTTPTTIKPNEILFFIYENEPSATFNLKNYLLVLAKMHCNPTSELLLRKQARRTKHQHKRDKIPKCKKS